MPFRSQSDLNNLNLQHTDKEELIITNTYKSSKNTRYLNRIYNLLGSNKLDLSKLGKIGIDRMKMYVEVVSMDLDRIPNKESLGKVEDDNGLLIQDESTQKPRYINKYNYASRSNKESIRYGLKIVRVSNPRHQTSEYKMFLDVTVPRVYYGSHNIYNVNELSQVELVFKTIYYELYNNGIHIDLNKAEIQSIELNRTFEWNEPLINQQDVLDYIFQIAHKNKSNRSKSKFKKDIYTGIVEGVDYSISSTRAAIKSYDKSAQILNKIGLDVKTNLCRIELTLNKDGIKNAFGSNELYTLRDMQKLEEVFLSYMNRSIIKPVREYMNKEIKTIEHLIIACNYRTLDRVYKSINKGLVDVILLGVAAFNTYKASNKSNFDRDFNRLFKTVSIGHIDRYSIILRLLTSINGGVIKLIDIPQQLDKYMNSHEINKTNEVA